MRRTKLTAAEKKKRQERNERRGRKSERKSEETPRIAKAGMAYGVGIGRTAETASVKRSIMQTVEHARKWKDTPPCGCNRCVERRALEAAAGKATGRSRLAKGAA